MKMKKYLCLAASLIVANLAVADSSSDVQLLGGGSVSIDGGVIVVTLPEKFRFDFDSSRLKQDGSAVALSDFMDRYGEVLILDVQGHTDDVGTDKYNLSLGNKRAMSLKDRLIGSGVPSDSVTTISFGKDIPTGFGHSNPAEDRRLEIFVRYKD